MDKKKEEKKLKTIQKLKATQKELAQQLNKMDSGSEIERKAKKIELLHEYNDVMDATQNIIGALANVERVTIKRLHEKFNLPID